MGRHWTRPHSEASASLCEVRFPASSPYALACGGTAHAAAGRATVGNVIPDFNRGYTYQKTDLRTLHFLELPEVFRWLTDGLRSRLRVRIQLAPPASLRCRAHSPGKPAKFAPARGLQQG
jgi:hypothetical protein